MSSSLALASSILFSLLAALSAGHRSSTAQWLVVVCACLLPSLSSPTVQQSLMIALPATSHQHISSLLCRRQLASLSLFGPPRRRRCGSRGVVVIIDAAPARHRHCGRRCGPVDGCETVAEDVYLVSSASGRRCCHRCPSRDDDGDGGDGRITE